MSAGASDFDPAEKVQLLLDHGADVKSRGSGGSTICHAVVNSPNPCVQVLEIAAAQKVDLDVKDSSDRTALLCAVAGEKHPECVTKLLEIGSNPNTAGPDGDTAIHVIVCMCSITTVLSCLYRWFLRVVQLKNWDHVPLDLFMSFLENGADWNKPSGCGDPGLVLVSKRLSGGDQLIKSLFQNGALKGSVTTDSPKEQMLFAAARDGSFLALQVNPTIYAMSRYLVVAMCSCHRLSC